MDGFSVSPDELHDAAGLIRKVLDEFDEQSNLLKYWLDPAQVGDPQLERALDEFQRESRRVVRLVQNDTVEMAERLAKAARRYQETDEQARETTARSARD